MTLTRASRRYLGSWTLPSGNSVDVYLEHHRLECRWDRPPSPAWPAEDVEHWHTMTFPEILRAVTTHDGAARGRSDRVKRRQRR